jgi:serine/threonine protein kinase/N-acetylneuraminic acid mutarotase
MNAELWPRVRSVLEHAFELAPEDRAAFLDIACHGDEGLRGEVEQLLAAGEDASADFLESAAFFSPNLAPGDRIGDYQIESKIGAGGMGVVYRARDLRLGRTVAIKVLRAHLSLHPKRMRQFEQEAKAAAAINHPNILAVYQMGVHKGAPYLVSEYLEGETLREELRHGPMAQSRSVELADQIADGLTAAHQRGIIHRDLKPENLHISADGRLKILDFGLAKLLQRDGEGLQTETRTGAVAGTLAYLSPEQIRGEKLDTRTDLYSLGVTLYEMSTGRRPFEGETSGLVIDAILNREPQDPTETNKQIHPELSRIVAKALEKDREVRYQSAAEIRADLRRIRRDAESSNSGTRRLTTRRRRLSKQRAGVSWVAPALTGLALLAFAGIAFQYASIREWVSQRLPERFGASHVQLGVALGSPPTVAATRLRPTMNPQITPATSNTWSEGAPMPYAVTSATAVALDGKIYVVGGRTGKVVAYTQIYSPETNRWSQGAPIPFAVDGSAGAAFGNYVYIFGGGYDGGKYSDSVYQYNPATNVWTQKARMPIPRSAAGVAVIDGRIYIVGGDAPTAFWIPNLESYDPMSDTWTELPPMEIGDANVSAAAFGHTLVISAGYSAVGGMDGKTSIYDASTNAWSHGAPSQGIDSACSGVVQGRFYLFGGGLFGGAAVSTTQIYDPTTNKWTTGTSMPRINGGAAGAVYNGRIYCFGGGTNVERATTYNTVEIYTP